MKVTLKDGAPRSVGHVDINVSKNGNTLEIGAVGDDPAPIVIEFYDGNLNLRVYKSGADLKPAVAYRTTLSTAPPLRTGEAKPATDRVVSIQPLVVVNGEPVRLADASTTAAPFTPTSGPSVDAGPTDEEMAAFDAA